MDVRRCRDLAGYQHQAGSDQRLASHTGLRIVRQNLIENGVGNLVRDLVRVTLGDGLRGEEMVIPV